MAGGNRLEGRGTRWMSVLARLAPVDRNRPGGAGLNPRAKCDGRGRRGTLRRLSIGGVHARPLADGGVAVLRPVLLILMAVAALVLLIACANLAGLLLARATAGRREIAIRLSMGAGRWRIIQQLVAEGDVLAGLGSAAALSRCDGPRDCSPDLRHLPSYRFGSTSSSTRSGLVHCRDRVGHGDPVRDGTGGPGRARGSGVRHCAIAAAAGRGFGRHRLRRGLVVTQVALSVVLLVGAGLCIRSLGAGNPDDTGLRRQ